jgi:Bacterial Ig domain
MNQQQMVSKISREIDLVPGSDYFIRFDSQNLTLNGEDIDPLAQGLSETVLGAIAASPRWIQARLTSQFQTLDDPESYANILLNASKTYADEIAFSIACCPSGKVPSALILKENAESMYEHDAWISYADIIENDDGTGNYSSTIRYRILENGIETYLMLPPDIYYWYVVHPKMTNEEIDNVYGPLWRDYLFDHNDLGYPLLKEKLSTIQYLWDCQSYFQPAGRLWNVCINQHPTAIEAISYWIGKTVPNEAIGDRPTQASVIAHEHNGWCGELQKIAIAAQRAALIPTIASSNVAEDHVWREFYERGWHENDNWWSDSGGAVDEPDIYAYGWGKNMSAIYQWRGDGTIIQDTERYIHEDDRITVDFTVNDLFSQPVDGARVLVLVKGLKDITFYKNLFSEKLQGIWDKLPEILKGKLFELIFNRLNQRIEQIPDTINGLTISTWGYTDSEGRCSFELGKNLEYLFFIQEGNLKKPWQLARHNTLRSLKTGMDKSFRVTLLDASHKPQKMTPEARPPGDCLFHLSFTSSGYQLQKHFTTGGIGRYEFLGNVDVLILNQENFQRYQEGSAFNYYEYYDGISYAINTSFGISTPESDLYFVFRNQNRLTHEIIDFSADVSVQTTSERVAIVTPDTSLFDIPTYCFGDTVLISGIATTDEVVPSFDHEPPGIVLPVTNGEWLYWWYTSFSTLGTHLFTISYGMNLSDERYFRLIDGRPPSLSIDTPTDGAILERGSLTISGQSSDNVAVDHVEITLNNITKTADGTTTWNLSWDTTGLPLGDHLLTITARDAQGLSWTQTRRIVLNETGHTWGPQINTLLHSPANPTNTSNMIISANVTSTGPFAIQHITLFCFDGSTTVSHEMYRYGENPIQSRHEEDPFYNQSNYPVFGIELGQFSSGQNIGYWIVAVDTAGNSIQSEGDAFTIP